MFHGKAIDQQQKQFSADIIQDVVAPHKRRLLSRRGSHTNYRRFTRSAIFQRHSIIQRS